MGRVHELKCKYNYLSDFISGNKDFEIRKNDRDFQVGEFVKLLEVDSQGKLTGHFSNEYKIKYIFHGGEYGLDKDYCILGLDRKWWKHTAQLRTTAS